MYRRLMLFTIIFFVVAILLSIIFLVFGQRQITSGILKNENGQLTVQDVPQTFGERQSAPAVALLPEKSSAPTVAGNIEPEDIEPLLAAWETFSPKETADYKYKSGQDYYRQELRRVAVTENINQLYRRLDSSDLPGVCPTKACSAGWRWLPGSFGGMKIHAYQPPLAYVSGYGLVQYQSDRGLADPRNEEIYYRGYGLILNNSSGEWRLQRAAAEVVPTG